jgi:hypothetical protein
MTVDPGSVRVASLVDDEHGFHPSFMDSFIPTLALDLGGEQRLWRGGYMWQRCTSAGVVEGRNEVVKAFLKCDAEWLWFVDADMGWDPDALEKLMAAADPVERPIVGGLCFGFGPITDKIDHANAVVKRPFPTIFDLAETDDDIAFRPRWGYVPGVVQRCGATGAAMLLIHRSVLEALGEAWFDRIKHPKAKKLWGEDTSFCMRAALAGFPVHVHAGVRTSHAKTVYVTETGYMSELVAEPATETVAVIVPVYGRPENAEPFMRSLRASTGLANVYPVCSDVEDKEAWQAVDAEVVWTDRLSFAEKVNDAYPETAYFSEPWVFLVGDDVRFHPGWLDHALQVARQTGAKVVGTNDWGNPRVISGEHATHMLIARDYIDEVGASWDGPGIICHEGYRHWFVDDEIVLAAKERGVWAPALASVVEHLHPLWGKGKDDETYVRGQRYAARDQATFKRRVTERQQVPA